jgi:hypothetical protein
MPWTVDHKNQPFFYLDPAFPPPPRADANGMMTKAYATWEMLENERRRDLRDPWTAARKARRRAALRVRSLERFVNSLTEDLARSHVDLASLDARISRTPRVNVPARKRLEAERGRIERAIASQEQRVADANAELDAARVRADELLGAGWDEPRSLSEQVQEHDGVRFSYSKHQIDDSSRPKVSVGSMPASALRRAPR